MEVDAQQATSSTVRPTMAAAKPAKTTDSPMPVMVDEAGMRQWVHKILNGHPGGRVTDFEQWGNSFAIQFKSVMDMMSQSLRIKEDAYTKMFYGKYKSIQDAQTN